MHVLTGRRTVQGGAAQATVRGQSTTLPYAWKKTGTGIAATIPDKND
jgi:hypothetical protein